MCKPKCSVVVSVISLAVILLYSSSSLAEQHVIAKSSQGFSDIFLTIKVNDVVRFENHDSSIHNITRVTKSSKENFGALKPGQKQIVNFEVPGVYEVICNMHKGKKMTVFVKQSLAGNL